MDYDEILTSSKGTDLSLDGLRPLLDAYVSFANTMSDYLFIHYQELANWRILLSYRNKGNDENAHI